MLNNMCVCSVSEVIIIRSLCQPDWICSEILLICLGDILIFGTPLAFSWQFLICIHRKQPVALLILYLILLQFQYPEDYRKVFILLACPISVAPPVLNHFSFFFLFVTAPGDCKEETGQCKIAPQWRTEWHLWWRQLLTNQTGTEGGIWWFGLTNRPPKQQH